VHRPKQVVTALTLTELLRYAEALAPLREAA
jgi:hypothetical protein